MAANTPRLQDFLLRRGCWPVPREQHTAELIEDSLPATELESDTEAENLAVKEDVASCQEELALRTDDEKERQSLSCTERRAVPSQRVEECKESQDTPPAADTQESQHRLLKDRFALGRRFARFMLSRSSGQTSKHDYTKDSKTASSSASSSSGSFADALATQVLSALEGIPEKDWHSTTRANVRPQGEFANQILLGLNLNATYRRIPMPTAKTFFFHGLTTLILDYMNARAIEQGLIKPGERLQGTTLQLTKSMQSRPHRDGNNQGESYAAGFGTFVGGQLFEEDAAASDLVHELSEDLPKIGKAGHKIRGRAHAVLNRIVPFNGKERIHFTMPWLGGDRYVAILFCTGTASYQETPVLVGRFLRHLGFELPNNLASNPLRPQLEKLVCQVAVGKKVEDQPGRRHPPIGKAVRGSGHEEAAEARTGEGAQAGEAQTREGRTFKGSQTPSKTRLHHEEQPANQATAACRSKKRPIADVQDTLPAEKIRRTSKYSDEERLLATPLISKMMEAADYNSNISGGAEQFKQLLAEAIALAPCSSRPQLQLIVGSLKSNTPGIQGQKLDALIRAWASASSNGGA